MNISIRSHIKDNFKDSSIDEIKDSILSSVNVDDEVVLPGMGVLFETLWNHSNDQEKETILKILHTNLKK